MLREGEEEQEEEWMDGKRRRGMIERERGEVLGGCDNEDS